MNKIYEVNVGMNSEQDTPFVFVNDLVMYAICVCQYGNDSKCKRSIM